MIGQHARGLPVPQCGHMLLPGGSACVLYSLVPRSLRCVEAEPRHIPRGQSQPTARKKNRFLFSHKTNDSKLQTISSEIQETSIPTLKSLP